MTHLARAALGLALALIAGVIASQAFLTARASSTSPQLRGRRLGTGGPDAAFTKSGSGHVFAGVVLVAGCYAQRSTRCGKAKDAVEAALGSQFFKQLVDGKGRGERPLRPLIVAMGTRGDAEPGFRLAAAMQQRGHQPLVVSLDAYKDDAVKRWGLDFRSCGLEKVPLSEEYLTGSTRADQVYSDRGWYGDAWTMVGDRIYAAATEDARGVDVIVTTSMGNTHCLDVAEKLDLLCFALKFCPDIDGQVPTGDFPPSGYPSLPGPLNYLQHVLENLRTVAAVFRGGYIPKVIEFRKELGMESMEIPGVGMQVPTYSDLRSRQQANQPSLYAFSLALADRPKEYQGWHFMTGSFASSSSPVDAKLPGALEQFLSSGAAPICVAFGSISLARRDPLAPYQLRAVNAARGLGQRVLVVDPDVEVEGADADDPEVFRIRSAAYSALFPRCSLVVHHGGAGTAQEALVASTPQLVAPVLRWSDQPFWAGELEERKLAVRLGEGGLPAPSEEDWVVAFQRCLGALPALRSMAQGVKERMSREGGVEKAMDIIEDVMS